MPQHVHGEGSRLEKRAVVTSDESRVASKDKGVRRRLAMFVQVIRGQVSDPEQVHAALNRWSEQLAAGAPGWLGLTAGVAILDARGSSWPRTRTTGPRSALMSSAAWWWDTRAGATPWPCTSPRNRRHAKANSRSRRLS